MTNELIYRRKARRNRGGYDGFLYLHTWPTGAQELVFSSKDAAESFAKAETDDGRPTEVRPGG